MPLFKVETSGSKRVMVKAQNLLEIIEQAGSKLNLPGVLYKVKY